MDRGATVWYGKDKTKKHPATKIILPKVLACVAEFSTFSGVLLRSFQLFQEFSEVFPTQPIEMRK